MPMPHLYILHPPESCFPGIGEWLSEVRRLLSADPKWHGCQITDNLAYSSQADFNIPTVVDTVRRNPGPVILIQKVQARIRERFELLLRGRVVVYCVKVSCPEEIWDACETALQQYEDGEPRIPRRELIAYLILKKLERRDAWGGTSLNKNFLWADDLPQGGFPKDHVNRGQVLDVAEQLFRYGILTVKTSKGGRKYALGDKNIVQPILDSKSFSSRPELLKFFERDSARVPAALLQYNETH